MLDPLGAAIQKLQSGTTSIALRNITFKNLQQFNHLLDALLACRTLETTIIDNCRFPKDKKFRKNTGDSKVATLEALLEALAVHPSISWLFFTNCKINDAGATFIADKL